MDYLVLINVPINRIYWDELQLEITVSSHYYASYDQLLFVLYLMKEVLKLSVKIWLSYPSYPYIIQFISLWHINLALYLSLDELIKGIISNWCQRLFKNNSYWEDMRRVLESSNSFLHHKIDWKNCEMDWSLISSTKIIFSYIIRFWAFPTEYKREASFSYSLLCYIYTNWKCIISSLIIIDSSFKLLLFYAYLLWIMTHTQWNK